jgi:hypothetical protein
MYKGIGIWPSPLNEIHTAFIVQGIWYLGILFVQKRAQTSPDSLDHFYTGGGKQPKSPPKKAMAGV